MGAGKAFTLRDASRRLFAAKFYAILDAAYLAGENFPSMCRAVLAGGADIVQIRAKNASDAEYVKLLESVLPQFEGNDIPLIVNDRLQIAEKYPRCGLHVGQDDVSPVVAREKLGESRVIGLSTHSVEQARAALKLADVISYFCVGPVFATRTKPDYTPVGLNLVRDGYTMNADLLPLFCIGGINRENVREVVAAGARCIVVVSDVLQAADPESAVRELRAAVK
jgi:thiamine-phosphate pyrophosphorylase